MPPAATDEVLNTAIMGNPGAWFEGFTKIKGAGGKIAAPRMNILQRRIVALFRARRKRGKPVYGVGLKPRKRGFSTIVAALHYSELCKHSYEACIIGNKLETSDTVFRMMKLYAQEDSLAKSSVWSSGSKWTTETANWTHGSKLAQSTAMNGESIRGQTPQLLHGCVPAGTPVITADGWVKAIESVQVGDEVLTHTGARTKVIAVIGQPNPSGEMLRITPWLGEPICFTDDHKIPTQRGIVKAKDVLDTDELRMPLRKIIHRIKTISLPESDARRQGGGRPSTGAGAKVKLTEAFGFACGYYLAEGCAIGRGEYITAITFARHCYESDYAEKACNAIKPYVSRRSTDFRKKSKTTTETCYGAALAKWFVSEFGRLDEKRIPDWVFSAGTEFCRGIMAGLLCGDGSKGREKAGGYEIARMVMPTTRSSMAMQARDLAAALGFGWASARAKEAGNHYGRNCKKCWRVVWTGKAARDLRKLIGASEITTGRRCAEKYRIEDGAVWIKIKNIEQGVAVPFMWDISVQHEDHTFRTPSFAIGNTEVAHWTNDDAVLLALMNAVPDDPSASVFLESTPNGTGNAFARKWDEARWPSPDECPEGREYWRYWEADCPDNPSSIFRDQEFVRIFAAWFEFEESVIPLDEQQKAQIRDTLDEFSWHRGERDLITKYGNIRESDGAQRLGVEIEEGDVWEQLAWRRATIKRKCGSDPRKFDQEHPADPRTCFLASGAPVFDADAIAELAAAARGVNPEHGTIDLSPCGTRAAWRPTGIESAIFQRWEHPKRGCRYIIPVDTSEGEDQTKGDDPDRHSVPVLRAGYRDMAGVIHPPRVVARITSPCTVPIHSLVEYVQRLHLLYGNATIIPEMNSSGLAFITLARERNLPIWQRKEFNPRTGKATAMLGWRTTDTADYGGVRAMILDHLGKVLRERQLHCSCPQMIHELSVFARIAGKMQAPEGEHDDDVMSLAIGLFNLDAASAFAENAVNRFNPETDTEEEGAAKNLAMTW